MVPLLRVHPTVALLNDGCCCWWTTFLESNNDNDDKDSDSDKDDDSQNNAIKGARLLGTYVGHRSTVSCVAELNSNNKTLITGSRDGRLKVWNKETCECLRTESTRSCSTVSCMIKSKTAERPWLMVCGMSSGVIEMRRTSDIKVMSSFKLHDKDVRCICQLEDGSFVSGSFDTTIKRWYEKDGRVLQTFSGHLGIFHIVMELKSDIIITSTRDHTVTIRKVSTDECLRTIYHCESVTGMVKLSEDMFATSSGDKTIRVVNSTKGECIETIRTNESVYSMIRLGNVIVTSERDRIRVRKLK